MRKRSRARRGFTLAETLMCVAILALVSAAGTTVTTAVLSSKNAMTEAANSQTLISTALDTLANELRYGQEIRYDRDTRELTSMTSTTFGVGTHFLAAEDGPYAGTVVAETAAVESGSGDTAVYRRYELLPRSNYAGLRATALTVTIDAASGTASIAITVEGSRGVYSREITVVMLNDASVQPAESSPTD